MRISTSALPVAAGLITVLGVGTPASVDTSGTTPVTFEVTGGGLNITVPTGSVDLGSVAASASAQNVFAQLGDVTVTDDRDGTTGWTVTASAADFTGPQNVSESATGSGQYVTGPVTTTGTVTITATDLIPLNPPGPVVTATSVSGDNTATWNPTITVSVPANALVGTYSSTITHNVA